METIHISKSEGNQLFTSFFEEIKVFVIKLIKIAFFDFKLLLNSKIINK